jgi:3-oxoacyl-[acyl-carrier-protein] synthase-3
MAFFSFKNISVAGISAAVTPGKIAPSEQTASDLGFVAANNLLTRKGINPEEIGAVIFVSKTPDYRSPATATVLHNRLKLSVNCIAYDINIGGAGFIYGLQVGCSLAEKINKPFVLVIVGDTTSKQLSAGDPLMNIIGDGAAALLLEKKLGSKPVLLQSGADGQGFNVYTVPGGGFRPNNPKETLIINEKQWNNFFASRIPEIIQSFLKTCGADVLAFDVFAFSQEDATLLQTIARETNIPFDAVLQNTTKFGNTSGCSIPLLLCGHFAKAGKKELHILTCGWGEGFSWGVASFFIDTGNILPVIESSDFYQDGEVSRDF